MSVSLVLSGRQCLILCNCAGETEKDYKCLKLTKRSCGPRKPEESDSPDSPVPSHFHGQPGHQGHVVLLEGHTFPAAVMRAVAAGLPVDVPQVPLHESEIMRPATGEVRTALLSSGSCCLSALPTTFLASCRLSSNSSYLGSIYSFSVPGIMLETKRWIKSSPCPQILQNMLGEMKTGANTDGTEWKYAKIWARA